MKNLIAILFFVLCMSTANAQIFNFGIKGGVNNNSNGKMREVSGFNDMNISSDKESGYHFGVFAEINLPLWLYIRPELLYTHTESSYKVNGGRNTLELNKIDVPILAGFKVLHWGRILAGPSFSFIMDNDLNGSPNFKNIKNVDSDDFGVNGQIGIGAEFLKKFGADLRYEFGLSETQAIFEGTKTGVGELEMGTVSVDTSPSQVIFSVYYKF